MDSAAPDEICRKIETKKAGKSWEFREQPPKYGPFQSDPEQESTLNVSITTSDIC
ncbi:MAG TPA: hypothetical protein VFY29_20990 [Terriglobia bacterium]|nr:hypothetical protein [Terriglobia bacterium]